MKAEIDVSVIILSYNPNLTKMLGTIKSAVNQKNINFEIIITDDGSKQDYFNEIKNIFKKLDFTNYKFQKSKNNIGTVKNCLNGLNVAEGKYIFITSPGDMLFNENVLKDFYDFCIDNNAQVCFGNAVYYNYIDGNIKIYKDLNAPKNVSVYNKQRSPLASKVEFFFEDYILGAVYFRERNFTKEYFNRIADYSKYVEDNTSTAFALADNIRVYHYDRKMVWYEYGSGISTQGNNKWTELLNKDFENTYRELKKQYPKEHTIDILYIRKFSKSSFKRNLYCVIKHPIISIMHFKNKRMSVKISDCTQQDINILKSLINDKV